ncbi:hypothetical protein Pmar_PMAR015998 [Perkinsus marinus ATCC 50983]|uniref:Uncharacterized protein n=1 Tax=Perkinsus marinus (strain ATCC 50983 / TXsc) TaxID=423536 RepID=C5LF04_PERM5|nr:hypothetical protein Pmar_PMAR015998 [Perkinsus marinus ATCC 50983]EER04688.1 hypothetical protein Pmar_PMAR015998 [Perkinsus marinus ATCC 50983]|eukprot:XP_002772872.1 hypothetical protein Pmar_PMAR015998 [Perkinsus marinus ATCC 50983]
MKFFAVVVSVIVALSLTGCSDDSTTTVAPTTANVVTTVAAKATTASSIETTTKGSSLRSTSSSDDGTKGSSGDVTTGSSGAATTTASSGGSCSATPSGKYCGKYMLFKGTATIDNGTFDLAVRPLVNIKGVDYTMVDCTDFEPDYNDPQMVEMADTLGMTPDELQQAMSVTYDESNDTFDMSMDGISLNLSKDQC